MFRSRRFLSLFVVAAMAATSAQAISIGRAGGFSRPSVSFSRPSVSRAPTFTTPTRAGGGQNVGMTRPDVMAAARQPAAAPPLSPRPGPPTAISIVTGGQVATATPRAGGLGWGTVAAAGIGGALVGHALTDRHPTVVAGGGGYVGSGLGAPAAVAGAVAPVIADGAYAAPVMAYASPGPSLAGVFALIVVVALLLTALAYFAWRVLESSKAYRAAARGWPDTEPVPAWKLPFAPIQTFYHVQDAFNQGDEAQLRILLGPDLVEPLLREIPPEGERGASGITGASFEPLDISEGAISIRYRASDPKDGPIHEVWHFVPVGGAWRVNGIEQV